MKTLNNKTYTKEFHCNNCGEWFTKTFKFGEVAEKGACPHCGVTDNQLNKPKLGLKEWTL